MRNTTLGSEEPSRRQDMLAAINSRQHFSSQRPLSHYVARSWERCLVDYKLNPDQLREPRTVSRYELDRRRDDNRSFLAIAETEVSNLYQQISGSGSAILLADKDGIIMNVVGDSRFLEKTRREGFNEGVIWSEQSCGTNGLGTCLAERSPVLIHHHDHFFANYSKLTCAAAPIFDHTGELLGVLDASSDSPLAQQYSVALVKMSAQMIENRVFMASCAPHYLVRFHSRLEFVGALGEGVIAFDTEGDVKAMNGTAQFQFDEDWQTGVSKACIDDFFDASIPQILHMAHRHEHPVIQLRCARSGRRFYASLHSPQEGNGSPDLYIPRPTKTHFNETKESSLLPTFNSIQSALPIEYFEFGDSDIKRAIKVALKAIVHNAAPVLITGQTGSGKSSLAASLHQHHFGSELPFTRINCASLKTETAEEQLFGPEGYIKKTIDGSLFLDEIGDMPLDVQPIFLHILEHHLAETQQTSQPSDTNFQIISATQRDLAQAVMAGEFRSDLFYRICGVQIDLKSLSTRTDTCALISHVYNTQSDVNSPITEENLALLAQTHWPGNIRQLLSVIAQVNLLADGSPPSGRHFAQALAQQPRFPHQDSSLEQSNDNLTADGLTPLESAERKTLLDALSELNWSVSEVAKALGLSRNTIYRKMSKYELPAKRINTKS